MVVPACVQAMQPGRAGRAVVLCVAALAAVLGLSPAVQAVALGVIAAQDREACPAVWSVPALLLSVLFPAQTVVVLAVLPVLFWSALVRRPDGGQEGGAFPAVMGVLGVSLVWHAPTAVSAELVAGLGAAVIGLLGRSVLGACRPGDLGLLRPVLLMVLVVAAQAEGLAVCSRIALEATLLDLSLLVLTAALGRVFPVLSVLRLPFPPLPGLVVLWLGIHAALGMAAGVEGWSVLGVAVALLLGLLGLSDILVVGRAFRAWQGRVSGVAVLLMGAGSLLLPALVFGMVSPVLHFVGGEWVWPVWRMGGGDGASLRLPAFVLTGAVLWCVLVRPWRIVGGIVQTASTLLPALGNLLSVGDGLFEEAPSLGWKMRCVIVAGRRRLRALGGVKAPVLPDLRQGAVGLWLMLLGLVLAVLGVMA
ncbi:hypothetical protein AD934_09985 [Gluconobacter oxydans]|uniref:NADH:quinone oxidoreductase/Mrp antiporter membrane subunit domain-containing protein n=1 Tax=Gluconobacter oxydans TaxID=442 RepID=A0A149RUR5_GLUOY|nr:hypothetical protein AD934_09985 [Gluconobacter oxydans]